MTRRHVILSTGRGERELFEIARAFRAVYALCGDYDRQPGLTVSAAIAYGERLLRAEPLRPPAASTALTR